MTKMLDKRKKRKQVSNDPWKPTPDEIEVATFLYRKLSTTDGRLVGAIVRTFSPQDAFDILMESEWAKVQPGAKNPKPRLFNSPSSVITFMNGLIEKQMFYRAIKVKRKSVVQKQRPEEEKSVKSKTKKRSEEGKNISDLVDSTVPVTAEGRTDSSGIVTSMSSKTSPEPSCKTNSSSNNAKTNSSSKPVRLEMSQEQIFTLDDPSSVYVWVYEPPPGLFNWLAGTAVIIVVILCCLFPIWPSELRSGAYYLTIGASILFGLLLAVALVRFLLYLSVWIFTMGKYTFWLFPNYFEDCGFFESFRPWYSLSSLNSPNTRSSNKEKKSRVKAPISSNGSSKTKPVSVSEVENTVDKLD